jgi:hypothetical protein
MMWRGERAGQGVRRDLPQGDSAKGMQWGAVDNPGSAPGAGTVVGLFLLLLNFQFLIRIFIDI